MNKVEKQHYVEALSDQLQSAKATIVTEYRGTGVAQMEQLRRTLSEQGISYKVTKNSLLKRALERAKITLDDEAILDLPIALATSNDDEVVAAKAIATANKEMETIIPLGGIVNGSFVSATMIRTLAKLPGRDQLYASLVGSLAGLPARMVRTINNPLQGLAQALGQIKAQKEA